MTAFDLPPPPHAGEVKIAFTKAAYPYWYADSNDNGRIDPEELKMANKYPAYTPRLLQAVYNYTYAVRDPGGAYHNGRYVLQLLYDSLDSLAASGKAGVSMSGKARPQRRQGRNRPTNQSMIRFQLGGSCSINWRAADRGCNPRHRIRIDCHVSFS